jgi:hypothetical protein
VIYTFFDENRELSDATTLHRTLKFRVHALYKGKSKSKVFSRTTTTMQLISHSYPDPSDATLVCYKGLPYSREQPLSDIIYTGGVLEICDCWHGPMRLPDNSKRPLRIQVTIEDRKTTVREAKIQIRERVPTLFRGDLNVRLLPCNDHHTEIETPADDSLVATWQLGLCLSVMDTPTRTVHSVSPSADGFEVEIPVDYTVAQVLEHKDVRRGSRHNLYCEAVVSGKGKRLDPNANFVDSVPRRGGVHIFEHPLVFIFSVSSRGEGEKCVRTAEIKDTDTFRDIQPLALRLLALDPYTPDRIGFTVNGGSVSEEEEPGRRVIEFYNRGITLRL